MGSECGRLKSDAQEVMGKEEGEKGGLEEKGPPFIPFPVGPSASCPMTSWQSHRPGPDLSRSYLISQATPLKQTNMILWSSSWSEKLVLVCGKPGFRSARQTRDHPRIVESYPP